MRVDPSPLQRVLRSTRDKRCPAWGETKGPKKKKKNKLKQQPRLFPHPLPHENHTTPRHNQFDERAWSVIQKRSVGVDFRATVRTTYCANPRMTTASSSSLSLVPCAADAASARAAGPAADDTCREERLTFGEGNFLRGDGNQQVMGSEFTVSRGHFTLPTADTRVMKKEREAASFFGFFSLFAPQVRGAKTTPTRARGDPIHLRERKTREELA